jgi:hypothetical protein
VLIRAAPGDGIVVPSGPRGRPHGTRRTRASSSLPGPRGHDPLPAILRANGKAEATYQIPPKEITTSKGDPESEKTNPWRWAEGDLEDPLHLPRHDTLGIRFRAKRGGYRVMTMQNGAQSKLAIRENKLGNLGYACQSSDGGRSFTKGWRSKFNPEVKVRADMRMPLLLLTS